MMKIEEDILAFTTIKKENIKNEFEFEEYNISNHLSENDNNDALGIVTAGIETLEITEQDANIIGYINSDKRKGVRLGTYVVVPYGEEDLFARIWKIQYKQDFEVDDATEIHCRRMLKSNNIDEVDYKFLAYLYPICILYSFNNTLSRRMSDRIPRPNTPILPVKDKIKIQIGLNLPLEGIFLGHLSVGGEIVKTDAEPPTVPYYLRNDYSLGDPLIFRHLLICGSTGTGKTFITKNILRQFMDNTNRYIARGTDKKKNPCLVILDPQDEYSQMFEDNPTLTANEKYKLKSEHISFGKCTNTCTFVAKVDGTFYNGRSQAEQIEFTIPFEIVKNNSWLMTPVGMTDLQYHAVELLLDDFFKKNEDHTYKAFINYINDEFVRKDYIESGKIHESSYDGIVRRVNNKSFNRVFDQPAIPINKLKDKIVKSGQVSVFPTEYISNSNIKDLITLTLMTMIVDEKLKTGGDINIKETPIILTLDEAHRYLSKINGEHSRRIISKFADAARQGRKEGLGLCLITQDPQDIDETIFKQINNRIILNLTNDTAIAALKVKKEFENRIPYLKKGQIILHSPDNSDIVEITGLANCVVKHV